MCEWGDIEYVQVKIPADLSHSGESYWKHAQVDRCIAPLVRALQRGGIDMRGSCCGHGRTLGDIHLQDGRVLLILDATMGEEYMAASLSKRRQLLRCALGNGRDRDRQKGQEHLDATLADLSVAVRCYENAQRRAFAAYHARREGHETVE